MLAGFKSIKKYWDIKGFAQFVKKIMLFLGILIVFQIVTIPQQAYRLPSRLSPFLNPDIGQALLFAIISFVIISRTKLLKVKQYKSPISQSILFGLVALALSISYFLLKIHISANPDIINSATSFWILWRYGHLLLIVISIFLAVFGIRFTKDVFKNFKKELNLS
ncbi:MAG: hypothetical protein KKG59_00655, partial [Nanoarchaeota archaeon]|nr:hypothetical protein [Nanoarchaeota archaeon]